MLVLPKTKGIRREATFSGQPSLTWGTALTSDSVANTEPATPTELIASTSFDTDWVNLWFHTNNASNTDTDSLVNIKVGGAGSEVNLIPNLLAGWATTLLTSPRYYGFPLYIPAGTRISATHRSVRTSANVTCLVELLGGGRSLHWTGTGVEDVGADTSASSGTYVTPGTTSDGTLTSIGTTAREWGFVQPMVAGNTNTTDNDVVGTLDLGSGASTAIPGLEDFMYGRSSVEWAGNRFNGRYVYVPTGTTLHARLQVSGTAEAQAVCAYGVF